MANIDKWERQHRRDLSEYDRRVWEIYQAACKEAAKIGITIGDDMSDDLFSFDDYPSTQKLVDRLMNNLHDRLESLVVSGVRSQWTLANNKNNELCRQVFGKNIGKLSLKEERRYFRNNEDALNAFLKRKENGLNLSDRVWNYTDLYKKEIEMGLDVGIRSGLSAGEMARELQSYLKYPDKLFRRVRNEHGDLVLSQAAKAFHPGQGVYRSSYQNARRMAVTETNMAYRTSDYDRYQDLDFVVGIEVHLSGNHTCKGVKGEYHDICDELQGKYPKDFKFTGWHPNCRCYVTSILKTKEEIAADNKRILEGKEPTEESENTVKTPPKSFNEWQKDNIERAKYRNSVPYFVRDNLQYIDPEFVKAYGKLATPVEWKDGFAKVRGAVSESDQLVITKVAQGINHRALENYLDIKKGEPMTFDQADGRKVNPHFGEAEEYRVNCQTCTLVYELRRRGFDIEAMGNKKDAVWKIVSSTDETMQTGFGKDATFVMYQPMGHKEPVKTRMKNFSEYLEKTTAKDGRYELRLRWSKKSGHVVCLERKNGLLIWYDPQTGKKGDRLFDNNEIDFLLAAENIGVRRMDDKVINQKLFSRFIKKVESH